MSTESFDKTSISENYISKKTPKRVNIDILKRKIYEQQKKEKMVGRIAIFTFFSFTNSDALYCLLWMDIREVSLQTFKRII